MSLVPSWSGVRSLFVQPLGAPMAVGTEPEEMPPVPLSLVRRLVADHKRVYKKHSTAFAMLVVAKQLGIPAIRVYFAGRQWPEDEELKFVNVHPKRFVGRTSQFPDQIEVVRMPYGQSMVDFVHGVHLTDSRETLLYQRASFDMNELRTGWARQFIRF